MNGQLFSFPPLQPTLWQRIRLWFKKPYIAVDHGQPSGDATVFVTCKVLDGIIFVTNIETRTP